MNRFLCIVTSLVWSAPENTLSSELVRVWECDGVIHSAELSYPVLGALYIDAK